MEASPGTHANRWAKPCQALEASPSQKVLDMNQSILKTMQGRWVIRGLCFLAGVTLLSWQFFTFWDVLQVHTAKAQKTSQSASWSGKPVGTMAQPTAMPDSHLRPAHHGHAL